jgi:WD40 repeat protein
MDRLLLTCLAFLAFSPLVPAAPPAPEKAEARTDRYGDPLPEGAVARLGTLRLRHGSEVLALAFSPDGSLIVTGGRFGQVQVWDVATGKSVRQLHVTGGLMYCLAFSPDGKLLAAADHHGQLCSIWEVATGKLLFDGRNIYLREILPFMNTIGSASYAPDGKLLATADRGEVSLRDPRSGQVVRSLALKKGHASIALFSPDGKVLASTGEDHDIILTDVQGGGPSRRLHGHEGTLFGVAFSPDGTTLVSGAGDETVRLWNLQTGVEVRRFTGHKGIGKYQYGSVIGVAFTKDGKGVISASEARVVLWEPGTGKEIREFRGHQRDVGAIALSPDGKTLAAAGDDGTVRLWEVATGKPVLPFDGHGGHVEALAFGPGGNRLASGGRDLLCMWDVREGKTTWRAGEGGAMVNSLAWTPDGKRLATAGGPGLRLWEAESGKERARMDGPEDETVHVALSPDGEWSVSRHKTGLIRIWNKDKKVVREFGDRCGPQELPYFTALSPDGAVLAVGGPNGTTKLWAVPGGQLLRELGIRGGSGFSAAFSPDGKVVAIGHDGASLYAVATGKETRRTAGDKSWISALAFSPDGRTLASADGDGCVRVWESSTAKERRKFVGHREGHDGVRCLAFTPDGKLLASGGEDTTILLWDVTRPSGKATTPAAGLSEKELASLWATVADDDAGRAYEAMCRLIAAPAQAVPFIKDRLPAVPHADPKKIAQLVKDLDAEDFDVREQASKELAKIAEVAEGALSAALKSSPSAEARRRAEDLLAKIQKDPAGEALQALRAVEVLEHIGTPEASRVLEGLARGAPEARLTRDARAALDRLGRRPSQP